MVIVGLYGGVAAGKSTVAARFFARGARVVDADAMVHTAYRGPGVRAAVVDLFGPSAFAADGTLDRQAVGARVFADPALRVQLEGIVHPVVRRLIEAAIAEARESGVEVLVLDVPLLAASPLRAHVEVGVFVDVPLAEREARGERSRGWQAGEVARRDRTQTPLVQKRALTTHTIDNRDAITPDALDAQVAAIWAKLSQPQPDQPGPLPPPPSNRSAAHEI